MTEGAGKCGQGDFDTMIFLQKFLELVKVKGRVCIKQRNNVVYITNVKSSGRPWVRGCGICPYSRYMCRTL